METKIEDKEYTPAIVSLFGNEVIAGMVSEEVKFGTSFIRVDVPENEERISFSRLFRPNAIFSVDIVLKEKMIEFANLIKHVPPISYIGCNIKELIPAKVRNNDSGVRNNDEINKDDLPF